jgi:hypothetical protein
MPREDLRRRLRCLFQLQDWPDKEQLGEEASLLFLVSGDVVDADVSITMMLEVVTEKRQ